MPSIAPPRPSDPPPSLPTCQHAIVQGEGGVLGVALTHPIPMLSPSQILIKTAAVALNPTDYKMHTNFPSPGATAGCDFAGTIVALGSDLLTSSSSVSSASSSSTSPKQQQHIQGQERRGPLQIDDRVCGAVHGSNPADHGTGAFAQYVRAESDLVLRVPNSVPWEQAAALGGIGHGTLALALWRSLGLKGTPDRPREGEKRGDDVEKEEGQYVLVYGGSTATGTMALQLLKASGYIPLSTSSPHNFGLCRSYGAAHTFDHSSPTLASDVRAHTANTLAFALDCITDPESVAACYGSIGRAGGHYASLELPAPHLLTRKAVDAEFIMGYDIFGRKIKLDKGYGREASPASREIGNSWYAGTMQRLWDAGTVRSHPVKVLGEGFERVLKGLEVLRKGGVSGQKLVVLVK